MNKIKEKLIGREVVERQSNTTNLIHVITKAEGLIEENNLAEAKSLLQTVLNRDDKNVHALNDLAVVFIMQNDFINAHKTLKEILSIDTNNAVAIENLKNLRDILKQEDENKIAARSREIIKYAEDSCPVCDSKKISKYAIIDDYTYYQCHSCALLFIQSDYLTKIDEGYNIVEYRDDYWEFELSAAFERSSSSTMARMAEVFYYSRIPINRFVDIGSGPGFFLDIIKKYLPNNHEIFYAVEKFPPSKEYRTKSNNYLIGGIGDVKFKVDAGICIEVVEHLTPIMLKNLFKDLASVSNPEALYLFNTGMPHYVMNEDAAYLDPKKRGHIISYSIEAIKILSERFGFKVLPIPGKSWAFILEHQSKSTATENIQNRIWSPVDKNMKTLTDKDMGSVLKLLGLETSRAYGN